jgi:hypothetical protein
MGILSKARSALTKTLDVVATTYAKPLTVAKAIISPKTTVKQVVTEFRSQPVKEQQKGIIKGAAGWSAALLTAGALAIPAVGSAVAGAAKSIIPKTAKGKVIAAVAAPIATGAIIREPTKTATTLINAPSELAQFGGDIASFAAAPSMSSAKNIFKESPLISTALIGAGVAGAGAAVTSAVSGYLTREEMEKQTKALEAQTAAIAAGGLGGIGTTQLIKEQPMGDGGTVTTPQTTTVSTEKRRYKRRTSKKEPLVRNSIRLNILNNPVGLKINSTKKYLNERLYN